MMYCTSELDAEIEWKCDMDLPLCQVLHKVLQVYQTSAGLKNPPSKCNIGNVDKFLLYYLPHIHLDVRGTKHLSEAKRGSDKE